MIRWTPTAFKQFQAIHRWIAADDHEAARRQCLRILDALAQIDNFPKIGRRRSSEQEREFAVPATPYIIFYRLKEGAVFIRSIRHGARSRPPHLQ